MTPLNTLARELCRFGVAAWLIVTSCSSRNVVVAQLEQMTPTADACTTNADCEPTAYCAKETCAATNGSCWQRPLMCEPDSASACGCDGVTYWNDCLRRQSGVAASMAGECATGAARCNTADAASCPVAGASCARLLPGPDCPVDAIGACWVLPPVCPPMPEPGERWLTCDGKNTCDDPCSAIRSGISHRRFGCR